MRIASTANTDHDSRSFGWRNQLNVWAFPLASVMVVLGFWLFPGSLEHKTESALHGLCAQRPSHSFWLGDARLPFDARMTGIYGGFAVSFGFLSLRGRLWAFARPTWPVIAILVSFVGAMAVDGVNSFLLDISTWHPYTPRNDVRLITGLITGIALAVTICFLLGATLWRTGRRDLAIIRSGREIALLLGLQVPFAVTVLAAPGWFYAPVALFLVVSAIVVVSSLTLVMWTIATRRDGLYSAIGELGLPATVALLLAIVVMASIAGGRFWLERTLGVPPLQ